MRFFFKLKHHFFTAFRELFVHHHGFLEFRAKVFALIIAADENSDDQNYKLVENIGKKNRWVIYTSIKTEQKQVDNELVDKLVLLMVKAGINSEKYGIDIKESEIESNIKRLAKGGLIGWFFKI